MRLTRLALSTLALTLGAATASAAPTGNRVETDFQGKPPFKRHVVAAERATQAPDSAATALPASGERLYVSKVGARPPFERRTATVSAEDVVEFARFEEEVGERANRGRRVGPAGKGHR